MSRRTPLHRQITQLSESNTLLNERIAELELALEDRGWQRLFQAADVEFSREGLGMISRLARLMYIKNPLIGRGVNVKRMYVWGQGINISAADPDVNAVIQAFIDEPGNQTEMFGHLARMLKEVDLECDGNIFFVLFTEPATGAVRVRTIPFSEITAIYTNPEDRREAWYYRRTWSAVTLDAAGQKEERREALYPAFDYNPENQTKNIGDLPVRWDSPVYHVKIGGFSDWQFGLSEVYAAIDWARAYKEFLENWASIVKAYARFAFKLTTPGGKGAVQAARTRIETSASNPAPVAASTFVAGEGYNIDPVKTAGATTSADDGRRMLLMVAAVFGLPETFFGDASVGSLATARSLDRPTELMMLDRQELWKSVISTMLRYVLRVAVSSTNGPLRAFGAVGDGGQIEWHDPEFGKIDISFPPIVADNLAERMAAIQSATAIVSDIPDETVIQMVLTALGVDDVDEIIDKIKAEREKAPEDNETDPEANPVAEAIREFREALKEIMVSTDE